MSVLKDKMGRWIGPRDEREIERAEETLGLMFPPQYRAFLREYGAGAVGSYEIYGLCGGSSGPPSVLWLIEDLEQLGLRRPHQLIPFHAEGDGDYSAILAAPLAGNRAGSIVYWSPRRDDEHDLRPAAGSFEEWLAERVQ